MREVFNIRDINFGISLPAPIEKGDVTITQMTDGLVFRLENRYELRESWAYITKFANELPKLMDSRKPENIFIAGLGLGLMPFWLEQRYTIPTIDILDINQNVIDACTELDHLNNSNFILGDMFMFSTDKKYDLMILDIWWDYDLATFPTREELWELFKFKLTPNGVIYIPFTGDVLI